MTIVQWKSFINRKARRTAVHYSSQYTRLLVNMQKDIGKAMKVSNYPKSRKNAMTKSEMNANLCVLFS